MLLRIAGLVATVGVFILGPDARAQSLTTERFSLPDWFVQAVPEHRRAHLNDIASGQVQTLGAPMLIQTLITRNASLLSYGYNGVIFRFDQRVVKVTFHAFSPIEVQDKSGRLAHRNWRSLAPFLSAGAIERHQELLSWGGDTSASNYKEALGEVLWRAYAENAEGSPTLFVSQDMQAIYRPYIEGIPLKTVLEDPAKYPYSMRAIWKEVVRLQRIAERILAETGMTVDFISAANLLVTSSFDAPSIVPVDLELVVPTAETIEWYRTRGAGLAPTNVPTDLQWVHWPLMPEQVLINRLWGLTLEQAIEYVSELRGLNDRASALRAVAEMPRLPIPRFEIVQDYSLIEEARGCSGGLTK